MSCVKLCHGLSFVVDFQGTKIPGQILEPFALICQTNSLDNIIERLSSAIWQIRKIIWTQIPILPDRGPEWKA